MPPVPLTPALRLNGDLLAIASTTPLQELSWSAARARGVRILVKREDLLHPQLSGNKFYKLYYTLQRARQQGITRLLSFGGAYSNHIHALAAAGALFDFETVGIIRGSPGAYPSPTLADAARWGMRLQHVSRADYRRRYDAGYWAELQAQWGACLIIPEGGSHADGVSGARAIAAALNPVAYDLLCLPCATGTTLAGMISAARPQIRIQGYCVLKGMQTLAADVAQLLSACGPDPLPEWDICHDYHGGGYARMPQTLLDFMHKFTLETGIPLDPVYTGKMFWGLHDQLQRGLIRPGATVIAIHTGGLQGCRGFPALLAQSECLPN